MVPSSLVPYNTTVVDENLRYTSDYHLQDAYYLTNGIYRQSTDIYSTPDTATIKQILMSDGAVGISYNAGNEASYYNPKTAAMYSDTAAPLNHSVLIAGWDDNYLRENFNENCRPKQNGAWLIRNSWGTDWGNDGYFWLSYEDKTIDYGCFYNMETNDNYARNYQHDTLGWAYSTGVTDPDGNFAADNSGYMSNVFTAEANEQVEAVSFYTTDAGTAYEMSIYTGLDDGENPISGTLASSSVKSGEEPYAGYHTIELDEPVSVIAGERFSVVMKLTNPKYKAPIPIEFCPMPIEKESPEFMGNGGESYVSMDGIKWSDAAGVLEESEEIGVKFYITNVCLKAFTNPVSTVTFSQPEGPVASGTELELTSAGSDKIYYTTDGSEPTSASAVYGDGNKPILTPTSNTPMTVKAVAETKGSLGAVKTKTYTQAKSELVTLLLENTESNTHFNLADGETNFKTHVISGTEHTRVQPQGADTITVNETPVTSSEWSAEIPLKLGKITKIKVCSAMPGKIATDYTLNIYRSALTYDYRAETVLYDEGTYTLTDGEGGTIPSGSVISPYILGDGETKLTLTEKGNPDNFFTEYVPARQVASASPIDFINEQTAMMYGNRNEVATNPEMSDAVVWNGDFIPLTPGQNVYIRKYATDTSFQSEIVVIEVPGRPTMPEDPGIDYGTMMTKTVIPDTIGYWFQEDRSDLKRGTGEAIALTPGATLHLVTLPTSNSFTSDVREVPVGTPSSDPASVEITFQDSDNNILKDLSYIKYYDKEGSVTETVAAPKGYDIMGEDTYVIDVTRNKSGKLVATPDAIAITVEQIKTPEPKKPSEPSKPTKPGGQSNDTPSTGDDAPFLPLLLLALSSLGIGAGIILFKKRRRQDKE